MPAAKRRKVTVTPSSINPSSVRAITAFTKVSKSHIISKWPHEQAACSIATQLVGKGNSGNKRKLFKVEEASINNRDEDSTILCSGINQSHRDVKSLQGRHSKEHQRPPQTPKKPSWGASISSSVNTPTKGARDLLNGLVLSSSSSRQLLPSSPRNKSNTINTDNISSFVDQPATIRKKLPTELLDLINLNTSFLTALSLHHAHNGADNPADLRLLCPDVARVWGKRKVIQADIQRILGVLNSATTDDDHNTGWPPGRLSLSNYGHGKICVEAKIPTVRREKVARPLDENRLNYMFTSNLQRIWDEYQSIGSVLVSKFIQDLPVETISNCISLAKMSPLLAKGQRRLEDLKAGIILKKQAERDRESSLQVTDESDRKPTLLERLKAKELRQSMLPTPPSKAQLSRNAAFHRLDEVVSVLSLLTTSTSVGQQRVSFTLPTILGKLRDSFKTPISKEEGENCVRLLASEIAPEWLKIIRMGKVDAVVVNRDNRPSDLDIKGRVRHAI